MARTNAFICDRCGKASKQDGHYQIRFRRRMSWASDWSEPIDLCVSCYFDFREYMAQANKSASHAATAFPEDSK